MSRLFVTALCFCICAQGQFAPGSWKTDVSKKSISLNELQTGGPPKDGIPSIDAPEFVAISEVGEWLSPNELVIVYADQDDVRAYPLQILMYHELVNDVVNGRPVLISYCPLCNSAIVFDRTVGGETLSFGVSGMLRNSDMVMYDRKTDSLWQQITGEAVVGTYTGSQLKMLPSRMIPFHVFAGSFPQGRVLSRDTGVTRPYGRNPYEGYGFGSGPIFPPAGSRSRTIHPMERLVVLNQGNRPRAYTMSFVARSGVLEEKLDGRHIVIFYEPGALSPVDRGQMSESRAAGSVGVYLAESEGRRLRFKEKKGAIFDKETNSRWNVGGVAESGPLAGTRLSPIPHGVYFAFAWLAFEPGTRVIGQPAAPFDSDLPRDSRPGPDSGLPR